MKMGRHHVINLLPPYLLVHYLEKEEIQFVASAFSAGAIRRNVTSRQNFFFFHLIISRRN
jgi:hypothetical protein